MISTAKWVEMILTVPVPLIVGAINGIDFFSKPKHQRSSLLYFDQTNLKNFLAVHWLLVVAITFLVISRFTPSVDTVFQLCFAGWFIYINIRAIIIRKTRNRMPTRA